MSNIMDSVPFSFSANFVGVVTGGISIIALVVGFYRSHLPSYMIRTSETLLKETEEIYESAIEAGLLPESSSREGIREQLELLREEIYSCRLRAYNATTLRKEYAEFFKGLSYNIGRQCSKLKELRALVITAITPKTTSEIERQRLRTDRSMEISMSSFGAQPGQNHSTARDSRQGPDLRIRRRRRSSSSASNVPEITIDPPSRPSTPTEFDSPASIVPRLLSPDAANVPLPLPREPPFFRDIPDETSDRSPIVSSSMYPSPPWTSTRELPLGFIPAIPVPPHTRPRSWGRGSSSTEGAAEITLPFAKQPPILFSPESSPSPPPIVPTRPWVLDWVSTSRDYDDWDAPPTLRNSTPASEDSDFPLALEEPQRQWSSSTRGIPEITVQPPSRPASISPEASPTDSGWGCSWSTANRQEHNDWDTARATKNSTPTSDDSESISTVPEVTVQPPSRPASPDVSPSLNAKNWVGSPSSPSKPRGDNDWDAARATAHSTSTLNEPGLTHAPSMHRHLTSSSIRSAPEINVQPPSPPVSALPDASLRTSVKNWDLTSSSTLHSFDGLDMKEDSMSAFPSPTFW